MERPVARLGVTCRSASTSSRACVQLRHALAALGREADAREIPWSILSGFRDDYRQGIARVSRPPIAARFTAAPAAPTATAMAARPIWTTVGQPGRTVQANRHIRFKTRSPSPNPLQQRQRPDAIAPTKLPVAQSRTKVVSTIKVHYDEDEDEPRRKRRPASRDYDDDDRSKKRKRRLAKNEDD